MTLRLKSLADLPPECHARNATGPKLSPVARRSKYKAIATWVDGLRFPSRLQARRYEELKRERDAGLIAYFLMETRFDLPGPAIYRCDFAICGLDGRMKYQDAKGFLTPVASLKIRQVESLYKIEIELWPKR